MSRASKMTTVLSAIEDIIKHYYEGLVLDTECLGQILEIIGESHEFFFACCECGQVHASKQMSKHGTTRNSEYHPICLNCEQNKGKKFIAVWGEGYGHPDHKEVDMYFFTEDNGYDFTSLVTLQHLMVGEVYTNNSCGTHSIVRIA